MNERGFRVSLELIAAAIESAVLLVNASKPLEFTPLEEIKHIDNN